MVILHFAAIENDCFDGVSVAVAAHIKAQSKYIKVGFVNISNEKISSLDNQLEYKKPFKIGELPEPFNKPDLVVFNECYRIDYIPIARNLKKHSIPFIIVPHGELRKEAQQKKYLKKLVANFLIFNHFINSAKAVQCLSEIEMENTKFGKHKFVCTNGVSKPVQRKTEFNKDKVKFIFIGRLEWRVKGLDILIDAVKSIEDYMKEHNCSVDIYGPGDERRMAVQAMIDEKNLGELITLHHEISGLEKEKKMLDADIFIQTSRHEGMPMGLLEALSYGMPCLITEGTALGQFVSDYDAGWVSATEAQSLSQVIIQSVENRDLWKKKGDNAIRIIDDCFNWDDIAQKTIGKYRELIS